MASKRTRAFLADEEPLDLSTKKSSSFSNGKTTVKHLFELEYISELGENNPNYVKLKFLSDQILNL